MAIIISKAREKDIKAKKQFGQNFLKDQSVFNQIIESMSKEWQSIVEIGPGLGDLTRHLVINRDVTAYEIDAELCKKLHALFHDELEEKRLQLVCSDVLACWQSVRLLPKPYALVSNLPYYVATHIILKAMHDPNCQGMLVMVQKEVAEKFSAEPGNRIYGSLAILASEFGEAVRCFDVGPDAFVPRPKVMSSVLKIEKHKTLNDSDFEAFLKYAFAQPRKTLTKNLGSRYDKSLVTATAEALELAPGIRPHQVGPSVYHQLFERLHKGDIHA